MSAFVANQPNAAASVLTRDDGAILAGADDFWPSIDTLDLANAMRLDGTVTPDRLRYATLAAIVEVQDDLQRWVDAQRAAGITTLEDQDQAAGATRRSLYLYRRAVYCLTAANLAERFRSFDSASQSKQLLEGRQAEITSTADELRRDARWAIADLQGKRRNVVELI